MFDKGKYEKEGGEDNVNLHPELDDGRCGVDEWDKDCMAQKTKHEVDAGAVYSSGYEHCKCPCAVSGGKAAMVGESPQCSGVKLHACDARESGGEREGEESEVDSRRREG